VPTASALVMYPYAMVNSVNKVSGLMVSQKLESIAANVTFLSHHDGGRRTLPSFRSKPWYRPHIVIQEPMIRSADVDANGLGTKLYLGVEFIDGPDHPEFGRCGQYQLLLPYHPHVDYSSVLEGATFTVREGNRIVGYGAVLSRS
jgi:hypothetical protein